MPASNPTPLPVLATSARALAAARPGEEVVVRVAMEPPPEWGGREPLTTGPRKDKRRLWGVREHPVGGRITERRRAPAAVGERVAVKCVACSGTGCDYMGLTMEPVPCHDCGGEKVFLATVTAAPEPERWCEGCEGDTVLFDGERAEHGGCLECAEDCPTCHGTPSEHVWKFTVRKEIQ